jgi:hypothetical protein
MRSVPVAILLCAATLLAGCSGGGEDDELHYVCPGGMEIHQDDHPSANTTKDLAKFCPKSSTTGSKSNSTSQAPNVLPTLVLKVSDDGGNATVVTLLDGNLTFDATGSSDPDGSIAGIAVTVTDSNQTRTASLYDAGKKQFKSATFMFDRPGPVNVTVAMVDDRAGFTVNQTHVYVNEILMPAGSTMHGAGADQAPIASECDSGLDPLVSPNFYKEIPFNVVEGVTWIDATVTADAVITICTPRPDPDTAGTPVSPQAAGAVQSTPGAVLPKAVGTQNYYLGTYSQGPNSAVAGTITVHYEPDTRAAA